MSTTPLRLLVVEDVAEDAELLVEHLRLGGFAPEFERVDTADAMSAALESRAWEVITCDCVMPKFSGAAALRILQASGHDLPFIIVSGHIGEEAAVEMMKAGAHDFVRKDNLKRLVPVMRRELRDAETRRQHRLMQQLLRESEAHFRSLARVSPVGIFRADSAGGCVYVNERWCEITGLAAEQALGTGWAQALHPEDRERVTTAWERCVGGNQPFAMEYRFMRTADTVTWVLARAVSEGAADATGGYVGTITDITELKNAQATRDQLAAIVESSNDAIVGRALDGTITSWNHAAERLFGWTATEALGQPISILVPPERRGELRPLIDRVVAGETLGAVESVHQRKDGARIMTSVSLSAIRDTSDKLAGVALIYRDISERKRLEQEAQHKAALTQLMERLARTANEAATPSEAMQRCLEHISDYGNWSLGSVGTFAHPHVGGVPRSLYWLAKEPERYAEFVRMSERTDHSATRGYFVGKVLREKQAVWIRDLSALGAPGRVGLAARLGLRAAFAFPVIVGVEVAAYLEFFSEEPREPDLPLLDAIGTVGSSLARLVERARAEEAHARLAAIVANANDAIISRDLERRIRTWNPAAERLFGWSAREAIGQSVDIIIPDEDREDSAQARREVETGHAAGARETVRMAKDGRRIDVSLIQSPIKDERGKVIGISVIFRDIGERKRMEQEAQRKARLTGLLESLARAANEAATPEEAMRACLARILEYGRWSIGRLGIYEAGEEQAFPKRSFWHGSDLDRYEAFIAASADRQHWRPRGRFLPTAVRERRPVWIEEIVPRTSSHRLAIARQCGLRSAFAFPVVVQDHVAAVLEFFSEDARARDPLLLEALGSVSSQLARLIERHRAQQADARLAAIVDSSNEAIIGRSLDGTITSWNRGAERMLGYTAGEAIGKPATFILLPERWHAMEDNLARIGRGEKVPPHETKRVAKGNRVIDVLSSHSPIRDAGGGVIGSSVILTDITELKRAREQVQYLANYDRLTELPNRSLFLDRLATSVARAKRRGEAVGVLLVNLDRFQNINESLGHDAGDEILSLVAQREKELLREVDTIARVGGNEFGILVESIVSVSDLTAIAEKLVQSLSMPFAAHGQDVFVSASIGAAYGRDTTLDPQALLDNAESAMAEVKKDGGNGYRCFEEQSPAPRGARFTLETRLRRALEREALILHYQPKVRLLTGDIIGAEGLLRWHDDELGFVSPGQFIPIAEETGLIVPIGKWVVRTACAAAAAWRRSGHDLHVAVNLSPRQFRQKDLVRTVREALSLAGLEADHLELEITESTAMTHPEQAATVLRALRDLGVKLSVDDFGTGYSSLAYLQRLPLHSLKIDRSFVRDLATDANSRAIVQATVALAHSLNLNVVAEGVETEAQRDALAAMGCDEAQGFLYSPALPADGFLGLLPNRAQQASGGNSSWPRRSAS